MSSRTFLWDLGYSPCIQFSFCWSPSVRAVEQGQAAGAGPSVMCGVDTSEENKTEQRMWTEHPPSSLPAAYPFPKTRLNHSYLKPSQLPIQ